MRVLYLTGWYPYPPDNGSKLRIWNLLTELARRHSITLVVLAESRVDEQPLPLGGVCKVIQVPARPYRPGSMRSLLGLLSPTPRVIVDTHQPLMSRSIRQELQSGGYQVLVATEWITAAYCGAIPGIPAVFENAEFGIFESRMRQAPSALSRFRLRLPLLKLSCYLRRLLPRFRACTVASEPEKKLLRMLAPGYESVEVVPNCVRVDDYTGISRDRRPNTMIFTGSFAYQANYKAMCWFLGDVFPLIVAQVPDAHLIITGDHRDLPLPGSGRQVTRTGVVGDVRPLVAAAAASIAPLILGGGTRLKILEAMCLKTPVVSTSKGCEGLAVVDGEHLLVADTPQAFAARTIRLLRDKGLGDSLAANAYSLVAANYDSVVVGRRFCELLESLVS